MAKSKSFEITVKNKRRDHNHHPSNYRVVGGKHERLSIVRKRIRNEVKVAIIAFIQKGVDIPHIWEHRHNVLNNTDR